MHLVDMSSLSPTARVILGLLAWRPRTGYEIKQVTDQSTRFFWGASYGQIYPELRRLEADGLVESREEPRGRVPRRVYSLTKAGRRRARRVARGAGRRRTRSATRACSSSSSAT